MDKRRIKMSAKNVFRQNYWRCVLAGVVSVLALGSVGYSGASSSVENGGVDNMIYRLSYSTGISVVAIVIALIGFLAVSTIVSMLIAVLCVIRLQWEQADFSLRIQKCRQVPERLYMHLMVGVTLR